MELTERNEHMTGVKPAASKKEHPALFWVGLVFFVFGVAALFFMLGMVLASEFRTVGWDGVFGPSTPSILIGTILLLLSRRRLRHGWFWSGIVLFTYGLVTCPNWLLLYHWPSFPHDSSQMLSAILIFSLPFAIAGAVFVWLGWPRTGVKHPRAEVSGFIAVSVLICIVAVVGSLFSGHGREQDILSFSDDFEDGVADGWKLGGWGWGVAVVDDNYFLGGRAQGAWPLVTWTEDFMMDVDFNLLNGGFEFNLRNPSYGDHYTVNINEHGVGLSREVAHYYMNLDYAKADIDLHQWHNIRIALHGGSITVHIDDELKIDYLDEEPVGAGGIYINIHEGSDVRVDNIVVQPVPGSDPVSKDISTDEWNFFSLLAGVLGGITVLPVPLWAIRKATGRKGRDARVRQFKAKLDEWEAEGYDVEELRRKWFGEEKD